MSSASSVNDVLAGYAAGRLTAQQLIHVVAAAYYREEGREKREELQPIISIIERAHPGIVELSSNGARPGFLIRLAERPFPRQFEADLRDAVAASLREQDAFPASPVVRPGFFSRIFAAIRNVFRK